jgi:hypothetical protein
MGNRKIWVEGQRVHRVRGLLDLNFAGRLDFVLDFDEQISSQTVAVGYSVLVRSGEDDTDEHDAYTIIGMR